MLAVSPEEFRATVAHEFGHFSGKHGKFGATIYRQTVTWHRIWDQLSKSNASWLLSSFLSWYMPKFEALSFALRRTNEYEADAAAVQIGGARANATDLMRFD